MPETDLVRLTDSFDRLEAAGFVMNADWQAVHAICQAHEGERLFDWGHAVCHRIEGDDGNADYWFRRAGRKRAASVAEDWSAMRAELSRS